MKRILFVDDEPKLLEGLQRMLRGLRHEWEMEFVDGGPAALERLAAAPFDVVVTDMRMPGMDGSQLLREVRRRYPATVRIVLSGQCDRRTVLKAVGPTHQFLSKPCDSEALKVTVARACRLRDQLADTWHKELVSRVQSIGSSPLVYQELMAELDSPEPSIQRLGRIISRDVGMTLRILQLVNAGFFGTPQRVTSPIEAANMLGLETIRPLVLSSQAIVPSEGDGLPEVSVARLTEHSRNVARAAKGIAAAESPDLGLADDAFLAGLLHDVGIRVLAQEAPDRYHELVQISLGQRLPLWEVEKQHFNATHAEIGAYLIALWGLPDAIIETVALHHCPGFSLDDGFSELAAVHVADAIDSQRPTSEFEVSSPIDTDYLQRIGCADRLETWQEICRAVQPEGVAP